MRYVFILLTILFISCNRKLIQQANHSPKQQAMPSSETGRENVWVFIMAGQSNMAGRGTVEPVDTITNKRIVAINKEGELVLAKEPLHWYEPERTGLDCGHSFANTLIKGIPGHVSVLLIPTAVGGSSISQWLGDSLYRGVKLFSNFSEKVRQAKEYGVIKGILWHQGESDANEKDIPHYKHRLSLLLAEFRGVAGDDKLPVLLGELGSFSDNPSGFSQINQQIHTYTAEDKNSRVISTADLKDKGDRLHFDSQSQRMMGKRFAEAYLQLEQKN